MRRLVAVSMVFVLLFSLFGCGAHGPQRALDRFFIELKEGNTEYVTQAVYAESTATLSALTTAFTPLDTWENAHQFDEQEKKLLEAIQWRLKDFSYEIVTIEPHPEHKETVFATVDFLVLDSSQLLEDCIADWIAIALQQEGLSLWSDGGSEEDFEDVLEEGLWDAFLQRLEGPYFPVKELTLEVPLYLVENEWKVDVNQRLVNALTGDTASLAAGLVSGLLQQFNQLFDGNW